MRYEKITFYTTSGQITTQLFMPVKVTSCGINWFDELQVQVFTNDQQTAGYILYINIHTHKRRFARIKATYVSAETRKKYGKQLATEIYPIIK